MFRRCLWLVALLLPLHGGAWYGATLLLERQADAWVAAQGGQVRHGQPSRGGWPFSASLTYPDARIASGALRWQADALTLRWHLADPRGFSLEPTGAQRVTTPGFDLAYTTQSAALRLAMDGGQTRLSVRGFAAPGMGLRAMTATLDGQALTARLEALDLPGQPRITLATLDGDMTPLPDDAVPARRLARWRDAGGRITLRDLTVHASDARATLTGAGTLDAALRPAGEGSLVLQNAPAIVDAAVAAGLLARNMAVPARLLVGVLARPAPDGGAPIVTLPVQGRDGRLTVGGLAVAAIPPLARP